MLYIITKDSGSFTWHVGEKVPKIAPQSVTGIQADGDELGLIRRMFENIPFYRGPVALWYGDLARTIYLNLID